MFIGIASAVMGVRMLGKALATAGLAQAAVMAYLTYQFLAYPSIWGGNWLAYGVEIFAVALGIAIYLITRSINIKRHGIDIAITYTEIPPE
jgi:hypothetical protein